MTAHPRSVVRCSNCDAELAAPTKDSLCALCHLLLAGARMAGKTNEEALALGRWLHVDPRMQDVNRTFQRVADEMLHDHRPAP